MSGQVWRSSPDEADSRVEVYDAAGGDAWVSTHPDYPAVIDRDERRAAAAALLGCDETHVRVVRDDEPKFRREDVQRLHDAACLLITTIRSYDRSAPTDLASVMGTETIARLRAALGGGSATT